MTKERNDYRGQLLRRETDFENRTRAVHSEEVRKLQSTVETTDAAATWLRSSAARSASEADKLRAQLAAQLIDAEGKRVEAEAAAQKKLNIAIAAKDRMIATRDTKLAEAQEALDAIRGELDAAVELSADRLTTIRRICGKLGGQPQITRTEGELAEQLATDRQADAARRRMVAQVREAIGVVGGEMAKSRRSPW